MSGGLDSPRESRRWPHVSGFEARNAVAFAPPCLAGSFWPAVGREYACPTGGTYPFRPGDGSTLVFQLGGDRHGRNSKRHPGQRLRTARDSPRKSSATAAPMKRAVTLMPTCRFAKRWTISSRIRPPDRLPNAELRHPRTRVAPPRGWVCRAHGRRESMSSSEMVSFWSGPTYRD